MRFRLLALDVDGTVLDRSGRPSSGTLSALRRAEEAGVRPVLCTGRRFRRALEAAARLEIANPLVCNSGALVKDPATRGSLWRADLPRSVLGTLHALFTAHNQDIVGFLDEAAGGHDFRIARFPTGRALFDEYVTRNLGHARIDTNWTVTPENDAAPSFHLCAIGERPDMLAFEATINAALRGRVRTFVQRSPQYSGWMCEVLRGDASKWTAVLHVAALWKIPPEQICAVGDDMNDVPMLQGAGLGVAMGHAAPEVQAAADLVIGDAESDALAELIDSHVLGQGIGR
jgi:Cof subfamily protein (haloacid dehalogenase superfamily)